MKVCIWQTGHEIADTVASAVYAGFTKSECNAFPPLSTRLHLDQIDLWDVHVGYGILRSMDKVYNLCDKLNKPWFNIDKGYLLPGHYSGYYRISLQGTQHTQGGDYADYERLGRLGISFRHWRGLVHEYPVLVCPPTDYVCEWLPDAKEWLGNAVRHLKSKKREFVIRWKDKTSKETLEHDIKSSNYVMTFNSSVGWEALRLGVPCVSDVKHSLVGSHFGHISLDKLSHAQDIGRYKLFATMCNLQLTLQEIKSGLLWPLMQKMINSHAQ